MNVVDVCRETCMHRATNHESDDSILSSETTKRLRGIYLGKKTMTQKSGNIETLDKMWEYRRNIGQNVGI